MGRGASRLAALKEFHFGYTRTLPLYPANLSLKVIPTKIADQISDAILDACLAQDPYSRVACETLTCRGLVVIAGEITTKAYVDFQSLVRGTVAATGHDNALYGFDLEYVRSNLDDQQAVRRYRHGCRYRRSRRSGNDVRICDQRDSRADAHSHLASASVWPRS